MDSPHEFRGPRADSSRAPAASAPGPPLRVSHTGPPYRCGPELIGRSPFVQELRRMIEVVAPTPTTVLITGDTGTGKEVVARRIHANSERSHRPFVAVNCAALPESLVESELFGYERGAFTGAGSAKPGLFEEANTGTIFLDEVSELAPPLQAKLLRALQEREIRRLGGSRSVRLDVRVIAATNVELEECLRDGRLRSDLYYRLRVIELCLLPLRERVEDIPLLCDHFLTLLAPTTRSPLRRVGAAALEVLEAYDWPGNIRELENTLERAMVLARAGAGDTLLPDHLPPEFRRSSGAADEGGAQPKQAGALDLPDAVRRLRKRYVAEALHRSGGNKVEAARLLGISRRGLYDLIAETRAGARSTG